MTSKPGSTVIMPMRDVERYVREALESICRHEHLKLEVLVVDDGSTDRSAQIVRDYDDLRVKLLLNRGRGISAAFNTGLKHATGKYVMRCDADDWFAPDRVRSQVSWMEAHPLVDAVCGLSETCWEDGTVVREAIVDSATERCISGELRAGRSVPRMVCAIFRTDCLRAIGGCREYFETCEDDDLMLRFGERFNVWMTPDLIYRTRLRPSSICRTTSQARLRWYVARCYEFQRERLATGRDALERGEPPVPPNGFPASTPKPAAHYAQDFLLGDAWRLLDHGSVARAHGKAARAFRFAPLRGKALVELLRFAVVSVTRGARAKLRGDHTLPSPGGD